MDQDIIYCEPNDTITFCLNLNADFRQKFLDDYWYSSFSESIEKECELCYYDFSRKQKDKLKKFLVKIDNQRQGAQDKEQLIKIERLVGVSDKKKILDKWKKL